MLAELKKNKIKALKLKNLPINRKPEETQVWSL